MAWGTNPFEKDSDGDGFIDLVDEHPTREDTPPTVQITAAESGIVFKTDYFERVRIKVRDESRLNTLEFSGRYNPYYGESFWKESTPELEHIQKRGDTFEYSYTVDVYQHGKLSEAPDEYYVNTSDVYGSGTSLQVVPKQGFSFSGAQLAVTPLIGGYALEGGVVGTSAAAGGGLTAGASVALTGGVIVLVAGGAVLYDQRPAGGYESEYITGKRHLPVPPTSPDTPFETPEGVEIRLPSGAVYEAPPGHGNGYDRRYGWKEVSRLPGIQSRDDVGYVIRHPAPGFVDSEGPFRSFVGESPDGEGSVRLNLISNYIISAQYSGQNRELIRDYNPRGIDEESVKLYRQYWEHIEGREGHLDLDEIAETVESADYIYSNGKHYYFVLEIVGEIYVVKVADASKFDGAPGNGLEIRTAFQPDRGWEYINDKIEDENLRKIYPVDSSDE